MRESWEHSIFHLLFTFSIRCRSQWSSHPIWWWRVHGNSWPSSYSPSSSIALLSTDKFHLSYWGWRLHLLKNIRHKIRTHRYIYDIILTSHVQNTTQGDSPQTSQFHRKIVNHHPGRAGAGQKLCWGQEVLPIPSTSHQEHLKALSTSWAELNST